MFNDFEQDMIALGKTVRDKVQRGDSLTLTSFLIGFMSEGAFAFNAENLHDIIDEVELRLTGEEE